MVMLICMAGRVVVAILLLAVVMLSIQEPKEEDALKTVWIVLATFVIMLALIALCEWLCPIIPLDSGDFGSVGKLPQGPHLPHLAVAVVIADKRDAFSLRLAGNSNNIAGAECVGSLGADGHDNCAGNIFNLRRENKAGGLLAVDGFKHDASLPAGSGRGIADHLDHSGHAADNHHVVTGNDIFGVHRKLKNAVDLTLQDNNAISLSGMSRG